MLEPLQIPLEKEDSQNGPFNLQHDPWEMDNLEGRKFFVNPFDFTDDLVMQVPKPML